jgi:glycosyltransferase involved in cell wall biosynthesis
LLGGGPEEWRLRKLAADLGLGPSLVFAEPEGDVLQVMTGADIFVQPAAERAISARSLQALGYGMAVVAVAGGISDMFANDQTAVVCETGSVQDLAAGIERLLADHELARRLAANAIAHMRANHTMSAMAERTAEVYRSLSERTETFALEAAE